jgi:hypothetical protein
VELVYGQVDGGVVGEDRGREEMRQWYIPRLRRQVGQALSKEATEDGRAAAASCAWMHNLDGQGGKAARRTGEVRTDVRAWAQRSARQRSSGGKQGQAGRDRHADGAAITRD